MRRRGDQAAAMVPPAAAHTAAAHTAAAHTAAAHTAAAHTAAAGTAAARTAAPDPGVGGQDRTPGRRDPRVPPGRQRDRGGPAEPPDTRDRIQQVALELFIERGYEQTSLREIAERLGVTKAALYYHFRTKDEIVESITSDRIAKIEELVAWAKKQPRTVETRRAFIIRYAEELHRGRHHDVMRFVENNQNALKDMPSGTRMRERLMEVVHLLSDPTDPLTVQIKGSMALFALHATWFVLRDPSVTDAQRWRAAVEVALELVGARPLDPDEPGA